MPLDKCNLTIMAKAMGLIFLSLAREMSFVPQCVQCILYGLTTFQCHFCIFDDIEVLNILHGLTSVLLCDPFIFADSKRCPIDNST